MSRILTAWNLYGTIEDRDQHAVGKDAETGKYQTVHITSTAEGEAILPGQITPVPYKLDEPERFAAAYDAAYLAPVRDRMDTQARRAHLQASLTRGTFQVQFSITEDTLAAAHERMAAMIRQMKLKQPRKKADAIPLNIVIELAQPSETEAEQAAEVKADRIEATVILPGTQAMFAGVADLPVVELAAAPVPVETAPPPPLQMIRYTPRTYTRRTPRYPERMPTEAVLSQFGGSLCRY